MTLKLKYKHLSTRNGRMLKNITEQGMSLEVEHLQLQRDEICTYKCVCIKIDLLKQNNLTRLEKVNFVEW